MQTTVGRYLLNQLLPEEHRDYHRIWDKPGQAAALKAIAQSHPDKYRQIVKGLSDLGRHVAYTSGGYSFDLKHLQPTPNGERLKMQLNQDVDAILNDDVMDSKTRQAKLLEISKQYLPQIVKAVLDDSVKSGNPLAKQLKGAGRGDPNGLNRLIGADVLYADSQGRPIPVPVLRSYSQGLSPEEYLAGAYGARQGILQTKLATAQGGFMAKQLVAAAHRLVVSAHDSDEDEDRASEKGLPVDTLDSDNEGALLARPLGRFKRNTVLTPRILRELHGLGHEQILVRSPIVGGAPNGGVYARDVGFHEKSRLEPLGSYAGITAANSLAEPVTQLNLKSKHTGGALGASKQPGGFAALESLIQVPEEYPSGATHAQHDGPVKSIVVAPQGGHYVTINNHQHYVPGDQELLVKPGQEIEAGDVLSDGMPNPAEIVKHKGIGEGRRYFTDAFRSVLGRAGSYGHRRNIELIARGLINHVRLTDELGDWSPDDVVPYSVLEHAWQPRVGSLSLPINRAKNHYLERPVLHYTIGTRVTPSVQNRLHQFGIPQIDVHPEPPPFAPEHQRAMTNVSHDPDWMVRFLGGYQEKSLLNATHRGLTSDTQSTSFIPSLVQGPQFGQHLPTASKSVLD